MVGVRRYSFNFTSLIMSAKVLEFLAALGVMAMVFVVVAKFVHSLIVFMNDRARPLWDLFLLLKHQKDVSPCVQKRRVRV